MKAVRVLRTGLCASWYAVTAPTRARCAVAFLRLSYAAGLSIRESLSWAARRSALRKVGTGTPIPQ